MRIICLTFLAVLAGCASQPRDATTGELEKAASQRAVAASGETAAASQEESEFKVPDGFKPKKLGGETFYCRKQVALGSRFPKELCLTMAQVKDMEMNNQAMRDNVSQTGKVCTTAAGCSW